MRLRNLQNMPVFNNEKAEIIGAVDKLVIGDDYKIAYIIVSLHGNSSQMFTPDEFVLSDNAVIINNLSCIKSYLHGEELSIYDKKLGDLIFDHAGNELGIVSDFIICPQEKQVYAVEVSSGVLQDLWAGRKDISLHEVAWKSDYSGIIDVEGRDLDGSK